MSNNGADKKADIKTVMEGQAEDRGEALALMDPLLVTESSRHRTALTDLALELAQGATGPPA